MEQAGAAQAAAAAQGAVNYTLALHHYYEAQRLCQAVPAGQQGPEGGGAAGTQGVAAAGLQPGSGTQQVASAGHQILYTYDPAYLSVLVGQPLMAAARALLAQQADAGGDVVHVNAKQYRAILRRREQRRKLEERNQLVRTRKPYLHKSRHELAVRRTRNDKGQFLPEAGIGGDGEEGPAGAAAEEAGGAAGPNERRAGAGGAAGGAAEQAGAAAGPGTWPAPQQAQQQQQQQEQHWQQMLQGGSAAVAAQLEQQQLEGRQLRALFVEGPS